MKYDEETNEYELNNGLTVYPQRNTYADKRLDPLKMLILGNKGIFREPTTQERKEIAEYMIELWKEWAK